MEQNFHSSPVPVEKRKLNKANIAMAIITVLALAGAITFGILWITERNKTPDKTADTTTQKCVNSETKGDCNCPGAKPLVFNSEAVVNDDGEHFYSVSISDFLSRTSSDGTIVKPLYVYSSSSNPDEATIKVDWAELASSYGVNDQAISGKGEETIELKFPQKIADIFITHAGQATGNEKILFLMEDGTVEYIPVSEAVKAGEFKSYGKMEGLKNIIRFWLGSIGRSDNGTSAGAMSYAQDADGKVYTLYDDFN